MKNVLSVDNSPVMLKYMSNLLTKEGHKVITAEDGLSALDILETHTPDIMFLDLVMPNIDGRTLCRIIRRMDRFKHTPIIILSATAAEEGLNVEVIGATLCIAKGPFNLMKPHVLSALELSSHGTYQDPHEKPIGHQDIHRGGSHRNCSPLSNISRWYWKGCRKASWKSPVKDGLFTPIRQLFPY